MRLQIKAIVVLFIISFLIDWYVYLDIRRYSRRRLWSRLYLVSSVMCWALLAAITVMPKRGEGSIIPLMWMLYAYISIYLPKIIYVIFSLIGRIPRLWKRERVRLGLYVGLPLALISFGVIWWGAVSGRRAIGLNEIEIVSEKLPPAFDGYRIVQFSDAHVGTWGNDTTFISDLVDSINSLNPDMIVFTGDIVNRSTSEIYPFVKPLSRLRAKDGVYSIMGNHDYGDYKDWPTPEDRQRNIDELHRVQRAMGWNILDNDHLFVRSQSDSIVLIGVENWGEPPFHQYGKLGEAYPYSAGSPDNLNDGKFKILLTHNPEHWRQEVAEKTNVDLTLSGHTHAMQFIMKLGSWRWSPAKYIYQQWSGLYEKRTQGGQPVRIYVNIGCGEVGMPFRIGADPEITLIVLRSAENGSSRVR